jgi:hypothetical protein
LPQNPRARIAITPESTQPLNLPVSASRIRAQNVLSSTAASKYTLTQKDINNLAHGEATLLNQLMLQMPGAALDQNQGIHIRGEHMGIQYQMNGTLLPFPLKNADLALARPKPATRLATARL